MLDGRVDSCGQTDPSERRRPWRSWIGDPSCGSDSGDAPGSGVVYTPHSPIACHRCHTQCLLQHVVENGRESIPSQSVGTMALGPLEESVCGLMMALGVTAAVGTLRSRWLHTKSDVPPSDSASCAPAQRANRSSRGESHVARVAALSRTLWWLRAPTCRRYPGPSCKVLTAAGLHLAETKIETRSIPLAANGRWSSTNIENLAEGRFRPSALAVVPKSASNLWAESITVTSATGSVCLTNFAPVPPRCTGICCGEP